jgi:hypothetical protein
MGQFVLSNSKSRKLNLPKASVPVLPNGHKIAKDMPVFALQGAGNGVKR